MNTSESSDKSAARGNSMGEIAAKIAIDKNGHIAKIAQSLFLILACKVVARGNIKANK